MVILTLVMVLRFNIMEPYGKDNLAPVLKGLKEYKVLKAPKVLKVYLALKALWVFKVLKELKEYKVQ